MNSARDRGADITTRNAATASSSHYHRPSRGGVEIDSRRRSLQGGAAQTNSRTSSYASFHAP